MRLNELATAKNRKIGIKQSTRALMSDLVEKVFIAQDADQYVVRRIMNLAEEKNVEIVMVSSMHEMGLACKIDVGAAVAVIIKE